jgi:ring-1,2-phenylacetyl-CoA epoxidase subunit PaaD
MVTMPAVIATPESSAWAALRAVTDPEIPVLSVVDLGLIRHLICHGGGEIEVGLAPTYSGCPATAVIRDLVIAALHAAGFRQPRVVEVLSPPWTSDWLSTEGREKLRRLGIAPPERAVGAPRALWLDPPSVRCPHCESLDTEELSRFGSTTCKALHRCNACREPFEYFKCT